MPVSRILVVDDSLVDRTRLAEILQAASYKVSTASSGKEAIAAAHANPMPELIFMDVVMAEVDGFEACRQILKDPATKAIPIIFCTSKGSKADRVWAQMNGGRGLVAKPYTPEQILEQLTAY
jgi:twitching motility two-component system response regulator PilH